MKLFREKDKVPIFKEQAKETKKVEGNPYMCNIMRARKDWV